jgi:nucleoid-associated protein YgaU
MYLAVKASSPGGTQTLPLGSRRLLSRFAAAACALALLAAAAGLALAAAERGRVPGDAPQRTGPLAAGGAAAGESRRFRGQSPAPPSRGAPLSPAPEAQPPVDAPPESEYRVVWGDTLWRISERYYGDRSLYNELALHNGLADADFIIAGETLRMPPTLAAPAR